MGESISNFEKDNTIEDASELNDVLTKIEDSNELIEKIVDKNRKNVTHINESLKERKMFKKSIFNTILMYIVASSLISVFLAPKEHGVTKTEYTYENGMTQEELIDSEYKEDKKYILVYEPWEPFEDERIIKQYDVSNIELKNIEDYLTYDVNDLECENIPQSFAELKSSKEYNFKEIRKFMNIDYDENGSVSIEYIVGVFSVVIFIMYILDLVLSAYARVNSYGLPVGALFIRFLEYNRRYSKSGFDMIEVKELFKELENPINKVLDEIEKNDELRNKFVKLFNENKYLLNDPEILFEKYNELIKKVNTPEIKKEYQELKLKSKKYTK